MTTKTSHFFLRDHDGHRIGVVALRYEPEEPGTQPVPGTPGYVSVAVSLCHDNDPWTNATGVAAARGRLDAHNVTRQENLDFSVVLGETTNQRIPVLHNVFVILKPSGIHKRRNDVDWTKMQALFERQWKYLITPKPEKRTDAEAEPSTSAG